MDVNNRVLLCASPWGFIVKLSLSLLEEGESLLTRYRSTQLEFTLYLKIIGLSN